MNRHQDGSDEWTTSSNVGRPGATETSNEFTRSLPCVMSLRLLDSKDGPIASQLAPFAKSYDEAVLYALGAFPKQLPPGTPKTTINLKYPCRAQDGTVYWPGLQVAQDSREIWMRLMANSGSIPEIGVFVEGGVQQPVAGVPVAVAQPEHSGPLTGKYGVHLKMRMYDKMKQRWIPGTSGVLNTLTPRPPPIPPPLRYQECHEFISQRLEASFPSDHPRHKGILLRVLLQLKIWDQTERMMMPLNEKNYRDKMQSCATNDFGQDTSVQDYVEICVHYASH